MQGKASGLLFVDFCSTVCPILHVWLQIWQWGSLKESARCSPSTDASPCRLWEVNQTSFESAASRDTAEETVPGGEFQMPDNFDLPDEFIQQHVSADVESAG